MLALTALTTLAVAAQQSISTQRANGGYADPGTCALCHKEIAESYSRSGMARSFGAVSDPGRFPELRARSFQHDASQEVFTLDVRDGVRDGRALLRRHQVGFDGSVTNLLETEIVYWLGSGNHARGYIGRTKSGELVELPVTWYSEKGGYWGMSPGFDRPDHPGFSRKITYRCMFCHNAYPNLAAGEAAPAGGTRFPNQIPGGIDCQRCHGPGQNHVDAVQRGFSSQRVRDAIVNPARLPADRKMEVCMQCHLETTSLSLPANLLRYGRDIFSYRPGEPLSDYILHFDRDPAARSPDRLEFVSAAYRLRKSACFSRSNARNAGSLTCTTCHNPHEPSNANPARYDAACQSCHRVEIESLIANRRHPDQLRDCASCHMSRRRPIDAIHVTITDHLIQRPATTLSAEPLVEQNDGGSEPYRGRVIPYYPEKLNDPEYELYLATAQLAQSSNTEEGLQKFEQLIAGRRSAHSEFYFQAAEAYRRSARLDKALAYYQRACSSRPADWRHQYRLGTTLWALGEFDRALTALERARGLAPNETAILEAIAGVLSASGKLRDAVATLQEALKIDPESASVYANLGARMLQLGDRAGAERAWREALRLRPESMTTQLNLANLVMNTGSFSEASYHYKRAIRISPSSADAHFAYANALAVRGEDGEAEKELRETIKNAPNHFEANLKLGEMLVAHRQKERAAPYLHKAAESPDARIRDAAVRLLRSR